MVTVDGAELGGVGAGGGCLGEVNRGLAGRSGEADLLRDAGLEAVGLGGVDRHPGWKGDNGVAEGGGGPAAERFGVGRLLGLVEADVEAGGAVGQIGGRAHRDRRLEGELVAAGDGDWVAGEIGDSIGGVVRKTPGSSQVSAKEVVSSGCPEQWPGEVRKGSGSVASSGKSRRQMDRPRAGC